MQFANERMMTYLAHQQSAGRPAPAAGVHDEAPAAAGALVEVPSSEELDDFKNQVRMWLELDNALRKLKAAVKERMVAKRDLTDRIIDFMGRYNIEDLNTRDGKLRYKVVRVKEPLTQSIIKERLREKIEAGEAAQDANPDDVVDKVFQRGNTMQKAVLKRLKRRSAQLDA